MTLFRNITYLDNKYSPVALYNFNNTLNDSSGNGYNLTVSGTEMYAKINNLAGFYFDGATYLTKTHEDALCSLGEITVETLINFTTTTTASQYICDNGNNDELETGNVAFSFFISSGVGISYFAEHITGVNITYSSSARPPKSSLCYIAITRNIAGTVLKFYINGILKNTSTTLTAPTGGTTGPFIIGARENAATPLTIGTTMLSFKLINSQLTDDQIMEEYMRSIGNIII